jgi:hypothetical protein
MEHLAINVFDDLPTVEKVDLSKVTEMAQRLINMDRAIENRQTELERLIEQRRQIATVDLPELMGSIGMSDVGLDNGYRIEVEDFLKASLPSKDSIEKAKGDDREVLIQRREGAFTWLRDNKAGSLIKYEVRVSFDKGKPIEGLLNMLKRWKGIAVKHEETVHFKTLEKYVKEQVADGTDIPFDLFGVWTGRMAKVVPPAKK